MGSLAIWILAIIAAVVVGLWLALSAAGLIIQILGYVLLIGAVIGIFKLATRGTIR